MFIQPVSMKCTQKQYERDLKTPLLEMGYKELSLTKWTKYPYIATNYMELKHRISNVANTACESNGRYFIDHYNSGLFLALAAMTGTKEANDNNFGGRGEWIVNSNNKFEKLHKNMFIYYNWRKATREELINKFTKKEEMEKEQDLRELLQSGNIVEFRNGDMGIIIDTHLGMLIQSNESWFRMSNYNENLKSIGQGLSKFDIMRVRKIQYGGDILPKRWKEAPIIWERKEPKEITLQELIEKAGYKVGEILVKLT